MKSLKGLLPFFLFFALISFFQEGQDPSFRTRIPAASENLCYQNFKEFFFLKNPRSKTHLWRRFLGLPQSSFDQDHYRELLNIYRSTSRDPFEILEPSPEGLLALARAQSLRTGVDTNENIPTIGRFKQAKLESLVERLKTRGKLEFSSLDELTREIYLTAFGPEIRLGNIFDGDARKRLIIQRIIEQDLMTRGLVGAFKDYDPGKKAPGFLMRFLERPWGKGAATVLLNLPVLAGLPPLFLPGLKPIRLSEDLAKRLIEEGFNPQIYREILKELPPTALYESHYEIFRVYYMKGIMVYLTLASFYDLYLLNRDLDQENEVLVDANNEGQKIIDLIDDLQGNGVNLFDENVVEEGETFCQAIRSCLESIGLIPEDQGQEDENFLACQSITDPDNRCRKW